MTQLPAERYLIGAKKFSFSACIAGFTIVTCQNIIINIAHTIILLQMKKRPNGHLLQLKKKMQRQQLKK
jgi:hypothetical protein